MAGRAQLLTFNQTNMTLKQKYFTWGTVLCLITYIVGFVVTFVFPPENRNYFNIILCSTLAALVGLFHSVIIYLGTNNPFLKPHYWCTEKSLRALGFVKVQDDGKYATYENAPGYETKGTYAYGRMCKGKRILQFNREGPGIHINIKEDGGTRKVFAGYIESLEELKLINH